MHSTPPENCPTVTSRPTGEGWGHWPTAESPGAPGEGSWGRGLQPIEDGKLPRGPGSGFIRGTEAAGVKAPAALGPSLSSPPSLDFWAPGQALKGRSRRGLRSGNQQVLGGNHQGRGGSGGACPATLAAFPQDGRAAGGPPAPGGTGGARACAWAKRSSVVVVIYAH